MSRSDSIELRAEGVVVNPRGYKEVDVELSGVDPGQLLELVSAEEAVDHFGIHEILKHVPIGEIVQYYGQDELFNEMDIDPGWEKIR